MGMVIDLKNSNENKLKETKKHLKKIIGDRYTEKQLNDFIFNMLLNMFETAGNLSNSIIYTCKNLAEV